MDMKTRRKRDNIATCLFEVRHCKGYAGFKRLVSSSLDKLKDDISEANLHGLKSAAARNALTSIYREANELYQVAPHKTLSIEDVDFYKIEARWIVDEMDWSKEYSVDDEFEQMRKNAVEDNLKSFGIYATDEEKSALKKRFDQKNIQWKKLENIS